MKRNLLQQQVYNGIKGCAETFYIKNDKGVPDYEETDLVNRTEEYIEMLPPQQKLLLKALFTFVELGIPLLAGRPGRFSQKKPVARHKILMGLRNSRFYLKRSIYDSIKGALTMIYLSHKAPLNYVGHYKTHKISGDPFQVNVKHGTLVRALMKGSGRTRGKAA